jgi:putative addiction module killer protein
VEAQPRNVEVYVAPDDSSPFDDWMEKLKDARGKAEIETRINKLRRGIVGDYVSAGEGIVELRIHFGPGYRIYCVDNGTDVLILCAGKKSTQIQDIKRAKFYWEEWNR